ncbi:MAG: hypothetical protein ACKOQV_12045, partial [Betaproteobacteria bacterium]
MEKRSASPLATAPERSQKGSDALLLQGLRVTFVSRDQPGQRYTAVDATDLRIASDEFVSVVGP